MTTTMTPTEVCRTWYARVWNGRDKSAIRELFDGQARGLDPADTKREFDPAAFEAFWDMFIEAFGDLHVELVDTVEHAERVAFRVQVQGTHRGGKPVFFEGAGFAIVRNGKIIDAWNSLDFLGMAVQLSDEVPSDVLARVLRGEALS